MFIRYSVSKIQGTKHHNDTRFRLQSLNTSVVYPNCKYNLETMEVLVHTWIICKIG